jgi:hypothetical protein
MSTQQSESKVIKKFCLLNSPSPISARTTPTSGFEKNLVAASQIFPAKASFQSAHLNMIIGTKTKRQSWQWAESNRRRVGVAGL